jgi:hypothetical protein
VEAKDEQCWSITMRGGQEDGGLGRAVGGGAWLQSACRGQPKVMMNLLLIEHHIRVNEQEYYDIRLCSMNKGWCQLSDT